MKRIYGLIFFLILSAIFSATPCEAAQSAGNRARRNQPAVTWLFQRLENDEFPGVRVFFVVRGRRVLITERTGSCFLAGRQHYTDIPAAAITSCHCTRAGAGTIIYVIRHGRRLIVYLQDWDAEESEREPFRRIRVITLPR